MQTPKTSTKSCEGSRKISPRFASSPDTTQKSLSGTTTRKLKTTGLEVNSSSPKKPSIKIPKSTSPIIGAHRSPRSPISEKKRPNRVAELETQISQLEDALKTVKDQLVSSESCRCQAQQDAQESRKQLSDMSSKLDESQKLLARLSSEESQGIQELSEAGDEAWKSKLDAAKKLHSADLDALATAVNEIGQLQLKLDEKTKCEATQTEQATSAYAELHSLKETLAETLSLVETMKNQLNDSKSSESEAKNLANETLLQLETAKKTIESLKLENSKANALEVDEKLRESEFKSQNKEEMIALKTEVEKLKSDVETAEKRLNEEQSRKSMEITSAYQLVEDIKFNSRVKESELEKELKKSKEDIEDLKANLLDKETELQGICEENEDLNSKMRNSLSGMREIELEEEIKILKQDFDLLKSKLMVTETALHDKSDENEKLKLEIKKFDCKESLVGSESESAIKVDHLAEEIEKSTRKVARVGEQLEAAQAANYEMEAELRKLKVQSDQWRKAAEAAAAMLSTGNNTNRRLMERTCSMDNSTPGRNIGFPYGEDIDDDEFMKKKNGNMLKRIGVLWKKPHNK